MDDLSIKSMIQKMTARGAEVVQGAVISAVPLKIQIAGDNKLVISENNTYVPAHLTDYKTTCKISKSPGGINAPTAGGDKLEDFELNEAMITIYNALKPGEKVHVLAFNSGKQYFVLGRVN